MHTRIVAAVSAVLFTLLAIVAGIATDLHDRFVPVDLGARSAVTLDFSDSDMSDQEAFRRLGTISDRLGLGLVKVAPDLTGDQSGQVFVTLGTQERMPHMVQRFGDQPAAEIVSSAALEHSYASGQYLVTGDTARLTEFNDWLSEQLIDSSWSQGTLRATLELLVRQSDFGTSLLAAIALMVSLVLYWLSVKAKDRALRVLAGVSPWRTQYEDLVGFLTAMSIAAVICGLVAMTYVGLAHGWVFVPYYASVLLTLGAIVIAMTMVGAVALSVASWPSAMMLAAREPAVKSLRTGAVVLKIVTFVFVLAAVAPAYTAYTQARDIAAQQGQWNSLSDQVVLSFSGEPAGRDGGDSIFQELMPDVGNLVLDAESRNAVALSYTWTADGPNQFDLEPYDSLSLVDQRWIDLMLTGEQGNDTSETPLNPALVPLSLDEVPDGIRQFLGSHMEIWSRQHLSATEVLSKISFYRYTGASNLPLSSGGGGGLTFPDNPLVAVAPSLHEMFNDSFLISTASSRNLVFTGLGPTQELITQHQLQNRVQVKYIAEEGILLAQFTAYFAWLRAGSLVALLVALGVSAAIAAFITAVLKARRDFPLRLAGKSWLEIVRQRVVREWLAGAVLATLVILLRGQEDGIRVAAVAVVVLLMSPLIHLVASQWTFTNVSLRRL